jgi:hypothetical protein
LPGTRRGEVRAPWTRSCCGLQKSGRSREEQGRGARSRAFSIARRIDPHRFSAFSCPYGGSSLNKSTNASPPLARSRYVSGCPSSSCVE